MSEGLEIAGLLAERERLAGDLRENAKVARRIKAQMSLLNKYIALQEDESIVPRKRRNGKSRATMITMRNGAGFKCPTCGFTSARSQGMAAHLRVHKGES